MSLKQIIDIKGGRFVQIASNQQQIVSSAHVFMIQDLLSNIKVVEDITLHEGKMCWEIAQHTKKILIGLDEMGFQVCTDSNNNSIFEFKCTCISIQLIKPSLYF